MANNGKLNNVDKEQLRQKIQGGKIIESLQSFALSKPMKLPGGKMGVPKLTAGRLRAHGMLLNKILPDLKAEELQLDKDTRQALISAKALTEEQWEDEYSSDNVVPLKGKE